MGWSTPVVQYFVDSGALSSWVDHAAAVALIDAAARAWTTPTVALTLVNGGMLAEDVSGNNVYLGSSGPIWPADVASSNYAAKQIAIVLDTDGTLTDMLLGSGASSLVSCRTNAVTESVDLFIQPGKVAHAVMLLNGRCTGPAPEQQVQMQYQLMRAFGRVLGVGWSQLNDNVFTGMPAPTYAQQQHWPIMHPIDIVCGLYTYQCLPQPFTLREDDISALQLVYAPNWYNTDLPDQVVISGSLTFPAGQGMNGVNLIATREIPWLQYGKETWGTVSAVSGFQTRADNGNPVTGPTADSMNVQGSAYPTLPGNWLFFGVPSLPQGPWMNVYITSEPINPLYIGAYSVGPYRTGQAVPSGDAVSLVYGVASKSSGKRYGVVPVANAANTCAAADGTEAAPMAVSVTGEWAGVLCGYGHTSWASVAVRAGRTATVEVTATDEAGAASSAKARPVLGLWHASDAVGTLPTVAQSNSVFNGRLNGTTQLKSAITTTETLRLAITDQRGDGRPDYTYRARVLYADSVQPTQLRAGGGAVHIVGTGFEPGNTVTIGGVLAAINSQTATTIDALAPSLAAVGNTAVNDVVVNDLRTGGTAIISAALSYSSAPADTLTVVIAPQAAVDVAAITTFTVRLLDASGHAAANAPIAFTAVRGAVVFNVCGQAACTVMTDSSGVATTTLAAQAAGSVTQQAAAHSGTVVQTGFTATLVRTLTLARTVQYVATGAGTVFAGSVLALAGDAPAANVSVIWMAGSGVVAGGSSITANSMTGSNGRATIAATASLGEGAQATLQACAWTSVCTTMDIVAAAAADLRLVALSGDMQTVSAAATLTPVVLRVTDTLGHAIAGAAVALHQQVVGWQPACTSGRCPVAPTYGTSTTTALSDNDGLVSFAPLQYADTATVTRVLAAVGTQAALAVTLNKTP